MGVDMNVAQKGAELIQNNDAGEVIATAEKKIKAAIQTKNSFGLGRADNNVSAAEAMGIIAPAVMGNAIDIASRLAALRTKGEEGRLGSETENIKSIKAKKATTAENRAAKFNEQVEKINEQNKKEKEGNIWGWIGAAAMIFAGALLMIAGGAGAALIAAGLATAVTMALQQSGALDAILTGLTEAFASIPGVSDEAAAIMATVVVGAAVLAVAALATVAGGPAAGMAVASAGLGMLFSPDNLVAMGVDEDKAAAVSLGITIGLAVLTIAAGLGSAAGSSGKIAELANKGSKLAKFAQMFASNGKAAQLSANLASKVSTQTQQMAKMGSIVAQGINGASTVGGGAAAIQTAELGAEVADLQIDAKELQALLAKLMAEEGDSKERIEEAIAAIEELASILSQILQGDDAAMSKAQEV